MNELKLKICGMKYPDNIREVAQLAPDYMGFIFYQKSKRFVGADFVIPEISSSIKKVGVFVNDTIDNILVKVNKYKLDLVQLHGDESAEFCKTIRTTVPVIKAFGIDENFDFSLLNKYADSCDYFLFDTKTPEYGGSGTKFDWNILENYKGNKPFFLSGGIELESVKKISNLKSQISNLYAIDVNSKFEIKPGLKDIDKLKTMKNELPG
jgi:phosphoribosylanthranilate isomerase